MRPYYRCRHNIGLDITWIQVHPADADRKGLEWYGLIDLEAWLAPPSRGQEALSVGVRRSMLDVLGHVVHARIDAEKLQLDILSDMQQGYRPLYMGRELGKEDLEAIEAAIAAIEAAFQWLKWLQTPSMTSRRETAEELVAQILPRQLNTRVDNR
jgi:hypothetical protein